MQVVKVTPNLRVQYDIVSMWKMEHVPVVLKTDGKLHILSAQGLSSDQRRAAQALIDSLSNTTTETVDEAIANDIAFFEQRGYDAYFRAVSRVCGI